MTKKIILLFIGFLLIQAIAGQKPVNPNASPEARTLLTYLYEISGKQTLSENHNYNTFIVWGPSAKLLTEDKNLQKKLKAMQESGIKTQACIACANMYGVADNLKNMGIDVKGMGAPLSEYLKKDNTEVISF